MCILQSKRAQSQKKREEQAAKKKARDEKKVRMNTASIISANTNQSHIATRKARERKSQRTAQGNIIYQVKQMTIDMILLG